LDALVAPAWVLLGQANDQPLDVLIERRSPCSGVRVGPGASDQAAVPAQQGLRLDEEARPAGLREHAADRGEQGPVGGLQPEACDVAVEHGQLVAQHQDLKVLGGITASEQCEQLDGAAQRQIGESGQHPGPPWWGSRAATVASRASMRTRSSQVLSQYSHPTGSLTHPPWYPPRRPLTGTSRPGRLPRSGQRWHNDLADLLAVETRVRPLGACPSFKPRWFGNPRVR